MSAMQHGDTILANLHKSLEFCLKHCGDIDDAQKGKYNDLGKQVCKFEHSFILGRDMVKEAAKQATVETFDQALDDSQSELQNTKFKPQSSKRYMNFVKKTQRLIDVEVGESSQTTQDSQNMDDPMDVDDPQSGELIPDIDPITKAPLENPVRNKHCNHIYGYDSVKQSLQRNSRLRCPIMGCGYKDYIKLSDLIEDEELLTRLAKQRKQ